MMEKLSTILEGVDTVTAVPFDLPVQSVCADSRHVWPGSLFVALKGTELDGAEFIPEALRRGAAVIISNGNRLPGEPNTPLIRVKNPRRALSRIAANFFEHPSRSLNVTGITGTNGKTTTTFLLKSILETADLETGLMGTLGIKGPGMEAHSHLTTPDIIDLHKTLRLFLDTGVSHVVMEVSSHALHLNRVEDVEFDRAIFTNLGQDHLDFHGSMEAYFTAKSRLFGTLPTDAVAILNASDERFETLKNLAQGKVLSFASEGEADVAFLEWGMTMDGITGNISAGGDKISVESSLFGHHNLENIAAATAAAWSLEIPTDAIEEGITGCDSIPGRTERIFTNRGATVVVDYAHTPDAYEKLFVSLRNVLPEKGRLTVIFGCGGNRDQEKRPQMAVVAERYADTVLVTPDNPRTEKIDNIFSDIDSGFTGERHTFYDDRAQAIRDAMNKLKPGDILAIVGKGREDCQIVGTERFPHSDIDIAREMVSGGI